MVLNNLAWNHIVAEDSREIETARRLVEAMPENGSILHAPGWNYGQNWDMDEGGNCSGERSLS